MRSLTWIQLLCWMLWNPTLLPADEPKPTQSVDLFGTVREVECEAEDRLIELLNKRIRADWSNVSFVDVLKSIATQHQIEIWIDHQELKDEKEVSIDQIVDVHLGDATVWQALYFLIPRDRLAWTPSPGRLVITSHNEAESVFRTRIYDVKKILEAIEPDLLPKKSDDSPIWFSGPGDGFFSIPHVPLLLSLAGENSLPMSREHYGVLVDPNRNPVENRLTDLLSAMLSHESEYQNSSWEAGEKRLVVRAPHDHHFQIQGMLQALETFIAAPANVHRFAVRRPHYPHAEDASIFRALAKVGEFNSQNLPLRDVLNNLAKERAIRLYIDQIKLSAVGISLDAPVKLRTSKLPLSSLLHRLLDPLNIGFVVEEGAVIITTRAEIEKMVTVQLFNLKGIPDANDPDQFLKTLAGSLDDADQEVGERMFMLSRSCLAVRTSPERQASYEELLNRWRSPQGVVVKPIEPQLETRIYPVFDGMSAEDLITALPDLTPGWDPRQMPRRLGNALAIKQSAVVHERLEQILKVLEKWPQISAQLHRTTSKP